jgi:hypothetical protein
LVQKIFYHKINNNKNNYFNILKKKKIKLDPNLGFWEYNKHSMTYRPSPKSIFIPNYKSHFIIMGRLVAKSILD